MVILRPWVFEINLYPADCFLCCATDQPATEITQLTNLTWLVLSSNDLTSLPPETGQLNNLTWLYLEGNNFPPAERTRIRQLLPNREIEF